MTSFFFSHTILLTLLANLFVSPFKTQSKLGGITILTMASLFQATVIACLDCGSSFLTGFSASTFVPLQLFSTHNRMISLQWLPTLWRRNPKVFSMAYKALHCLAPTYLFFSIANFLKAFETKWNLLEAI